LHIRGGYIIPTQPEGINTEESRQNSFTLVAALDSNHSATGELFIDDGITEINPETYLLYSFTVSATKMILEPKNMNWLEKTQLEKTNTFIEEIKIFGVIDPPYPLSINLTEETSQDSHPTPTPTPTPTVKLTQISHDSSLGVLTLQNLTEYLDLRRNHRYVLEWDNRRWNK
jgi:hypothetical protein